MFTNGASGRRKDVALTPVGNIIADHSAVGRLTIFNDFQKTASSKNPSRTSTTPNPETAPRTKLLRTKFRSANEYVSRTLCFPQRGPRHEDEEKTDLEAEKNEGDGEKTIHLS